MLNVYRPADYLAGLLHLIFPELCVACNRSIPPSDACFCTSCRLKLSPSDMYKFSENEFTRRFWGRIDLESAAAMYYFVRKSPIQRALYYLKYQNKPGIGVKLGRAFGRILAQSPYFNHIDLLLPVPLHPRKERLRGYNQSHMFCLGLAEALEKPVYTKVLTRRHFTDSQTRKKRIERFNNVESAFLIRNPEAVQGKHILLVDDVLTTGATLEICARLLLGVKGTRLSMATIAIATR